MSAVELIKKMPAAFQPAIAGDTECTVQFNVSVPMHIVIHNRACVTRPGEAADPDVVITMEDEDLEALLKGDLNGMTAYMTGKLELEGDLTLAQRLFGFFDARKLV